MYHQVFCEFCGSNYHVCEACPVLTDEFHAEGILNLEGKLADFLAEEELNAKIDILTKGIEQQLIQNQILQNQVTQYVEERELRSLVDDVEDCPKVEVFESFEDQIIDNAFVMLGQAFEGKQDEEDSAMEDDSLGPFPTQSISDDLDSMFGDLIEEEHLQPIGSHTPEDLVEDLVEDLSDEPPLYPQESVSLEEDFELWDPRKTIKGIEEWMPIKPGSDYEDPYLLTPPPTKYWCFQPLIATYEDPYLFTPPLDKFWSFQPFIAKSFRRNSYDPSAPVETYLSKGSTAHLEVHRRLDGRRYKWDLKVV